MTKYRVIFDDPDALDEPTKVLVPSQNWLDEANGWQFATYLGLLAASR